VFLNGFMRMLEFSQIVAIDMEGKIWRNILRPCGEQSPSMKLRVNCVYVLLIF
jgi:hypothetical protein